MKISDILLLYDYNYWANQLMLTKAAAVSWEQLTQLTDYSWGSLLRALIHTMDAEYSWRNLLQHQRLTFDLIETMTFPTLDSLDKYWKNEEREMRAYLNSLQDGDMESTIRYEIPEGVRERVLWHCLVHVVNHGTQHRSECAAMLTNFGQSPGDIDLTRYLNIRAGIE
ncbi:MAG: DinB family protein [Anaerolineae bacterium]